MISFLFRSWDILSQHLSKTILTLILLTHPAQAILDTNSNTLSDLWEKQYNNQQLFPATSFIDPEDGTEYTTPEAFEIGGYIADIYRFYKTADEGKVRNTDVDQKKNFYFRTRTKTLPDGSIISANYGKIYGDFDFSSGNIDKGFYANFGIVVSYFNPTPNDRNVEFDVKRNLLPSGNVQRP